MKKPGTIGWESNPTHYEKRVIEKISTPVKVEKFDHLYDYRRMRRDGGKFRPKNTMPGLAPHVIHTEKPGESIDSRKAKL